MVLHFPEVLMNSLDAIRQLLPSWFVWLPSVVYLVLIALVVVLSIQMGLYLTLRAYHKEAPEHWADRARLLHPARMLAASSPFWLAVFLSIPSFLFVSPLHPMPAGLFTTLVFVVAYGVGFRQFHRLDQRLRGQHLSMWQRLKYTLSFLMVMYPHILIAIFLGLFLMTREQNGQWFGFVVWGTVGMLVAISGASLWLLRWAGALLPAPTSLQNVVTRSSQQTNVHPHSVWVLPSTMSNAFALPFSHQLLFTQPMLEQLSDKELEAITAHELSHLSESWKVRLVRMGLGLVFGAWFMVVPFWVWREEYGFILLSALGLFVIALVGNTLFRSMEEQADEAGQEQEGEEGVYARALEKIYQYNLMPAVTGRKSVHPDLYDRMTHAGVEPSFPKPKPPSFRAMWGARVLGLVLAFGFLVGFYTSLSFAFPKNQYWQTAALAFSPRVELPLRRLSWFARKQKDLPQAALYSQAAMELSGYRSYYIYSHLWLLLRMKQCAPSKVLWRRYSVPLHQWMIQYNWEKSYGYLRRRVRNCKP
ncbi:MAG: hypothetical protein EP343_32680 [Deltaproteobacteria bacterium]|nr:MAG: hypothetical protein EP343_32680 [Deltaproteobacteria bacterium]